jgi:hypothetical protein
MNENGRRSDDDEADSDIAVSDAQWENRQLCKDGNCIGVIGRDGRCRQCGLLHGEEAREDGLWAVGADQKDENANQQENDPADEALNTGDPDWSNRRLCGDGNCIGVIGQNGLCKVCGNPLQTTGTGLDNAPE